MVGKRKYEEGCAVAHALDLIGERWALLVVRELLLGPKRFTDLKSGIPGASPDVLTNRLRELKNAGVVVQCRLPPPAGTQVYELTEWGAELEPVVTHLGRWGARSPAMPHDAHSSVDSLLLSLRSMFEPEAAGGLSATIHLQVEGHPFQVRISDGQLHLAGGAPNEPTATLDTDRQTLAALLYGGQTLDDALEAGEIAMTGDTLVVARFLQLFPLPTPATSGPPASAGTSRSPARPASGAPGTPLR